MIEARISSKDQVLVINIVRHRKDGQDEISRTIKVNGMTKNQLDFQGIKFVLSGINEKETPLKVYLNNKYVASMFEKTQKGDWKKQGSRTAKDLDGIRNLLKCFNEVKIITE